MKTIYATYTVIEKIEVTDEQYNTIINETTNDGSSWLPPSKLSILLKLQVNIVSKTLKKLRLTAE